MRRIFWMAVGAAVSTAGTRWTKRTASRVVEQYAPTAVGRRLASTVGERLGEATREGRAAMAETEARLRARLSGTAEPAPGPADPDRAAVTTAPPATAPGTAGESARLSQGLG